MTPRRRWLFRLLSLLLTLLATVILGEILLRCYIRVRGWTPNCYASDLALFEPHPTRGLDLRPSTSIRTGVTRITINSHGLRGPEIAAVRPAGTLRVAILGGSSVFGYFVSDGEEAARLLETDLRGRGHQVEVLNDGVPGYNLFHTIDRFSERIAPLQPDVVLLYAGWNDLTYLCSQEPTAARFTRRVGVSTGDRILGQSALYAFITRRVFGGQVRLAPTHIRSAVMQAEGERQLRQNLDQLADVVERQGSRLIVCAPCTAARPDATPGLRKLLADSPAVAQQMIVLGTHLQQILAEFARDRGVPFIDAQAALPADETILGDYTHLTVEGERRLAAFWAGALHPLLPELKKPSAPTSTAGGSG